MLRVACFRFILILAGVAHLSAGDGLTDKCATGKAVFQYLKMNHVSVPLVGPQPKLGLSVETRGAFAAPRLFPRVCVEFLAFFS